MGWPHRLQIAALPAPWLLAAATCLTAALVLGPILSYQDPRRKNPWIPSPREHVLQTLSESERAALPYPPDVLPGGRAVETPYGSVAVFEWGPEAGERVLLMHGIGTPCLALGDMAEAFAGSGYRVMVFGAWRRLLLPWEDRQRRSSLTNPRATT